MNLKKNVFSCIIWGLACALLCGVTLIFNEEIQDLLNWPYTGVIGAVCGYLLLTTIVFFALRMLCMMIGEYIEDKERLEKAASIVLPVMILIGVVVYLVLYISSYVSLTLEDDSFYRQAVVSAEKSVPFAVHGASWLYPCLLHVMLLIFGNTPFAGVVLQIVLFFVCLLFLYIGMRAFSGVLPAAVSMAALGFLPISLQFLFSLTPEFFYLALYLFGFCLTGSLFRKFRERGHISPAFYLFGFLLGIYIGFLVYLDIYGISLYLFLTLLYSLDKEKIKQAVCVNLAALLGGGIGFALLALFASWMGKLSFPVYLKELFALYTQNVDFEMEFIGNTLLSPDTTLIGSLLAISFAFFVIPAFFIWKKNQNSAFILNLFLVYALSVFHVFYLNEQMIVTFSWSVLAGLGFYGVIRPAEKEITEKVIKSEDADKAEEVSEKKTAEKEVLKDTLNNKSTETNITEKKEQEKPAPGEPLHNPLPLPIKKSRPRADFAHQVKEADMKFDFEVADNDDFDV